MYRKRKRKISKFLKNKVVDKVENIPVNIFVNKNVFCKFTWENKFVFLKLKFFVESLRIKDNK